MIFSRNELGNFENSSDKQWLVTNGIGGYASSSLTGANTSKYHGLLFASLRPPVERTLLLAKLDEEVTIGDQIYLLGCNQTGSGIYPEGHQYLQSFEMRPFPTYTYAFRGVILEKVVFMVRESNTTIVRYTVYTGGEEPVQFRITPLMNCRHFHHTVRKNDWVFNQTTEEKMAVIEAYPGAPQLKLYSDKATYHRGQGHWFEGLYYEQEHQRGLDHWEDHYMPGTFRASLLNGESFSIIASTEFEKEITNPFLEQISAERRLVNLVEKAGFQEEFVNRLVLASDNFIVRRESTNAKTIIAGYPWFTDWGRDTMIALPGLTLVTGRFDEAKEILHTFARYCLDGLIPNMFPDEGEDPLYNTVDASLWFFHAAFKYIEYTRDESFIKSEIYPVLKEIISSYSEGTRYNIKMDDDALISAGEHGTQLTWMDAKVGDWVVTPRHGKPVEINALWYNALEIMNRFAKNFGDTGVNYDRIAGRVRNSFVEKFWNAEKGCLFDVVTPSGADGSIRPNQIFSVSLPYSPLDHAKQLRVVNTVWRELYFSYGLRSLAPGEQNYKGRYRGDVLLRDAAYHQGTGWAWLIGPFITAFRKVHDYSAESRTVAERFCAPFKAHLREHGIGTVSEIFDGDSPHSPRGCFAQAWSVGEILRAYVEDILEAAPKK